MKSKRLAIFTLSLLISNGCLAQEVSEPVAHQYKRYHGDGIDNVLEYVPTAAVTYSLKHTIHEMRPDGTDNHSFPSGHTLSSVISACVLLHTSAVIGIIAVIMCAFILFSRMYLFVHYPSDVLGGISLGIIISEIVMTI